MPGKTDARYTCRVQCHRSVVRFAARVQFETRCAVANTLKKIFRNIPSTAKTAPMPSGRGRLPYLPGGPVTTAAIVLCACLLTACLPSNDDGELPPVVPGEPVFPGTAEPPEVGPETGGDPDQPGGTEEPVDGISEETPSKQDGSDATAGEPGADETQGGVSTPTGVLADGPATEANPLEVGVLLPLSGAYASVGQELLNAIELALFEVDADHVVLLPRDTASNSDAALAAFLGAVSDGADVVVGPLFAWTTAAIAPEARARGIPILSLSNDTSLAGDGAWMLGVHPSGEVRRALDYALDQPGRRVGLIAPISAYGDAIVDAYRSHLPPANQSGLARYGGEISAGSAVETFVKNAPGGARRAGDTILIAARGNDLRALAAELAYRNVAPDQIRYLGLSSWRTSDIQGEPALEGGRFVDLADSQFERFAGRFARTYGSQPSRTAALAYDVTAVAANMARVHASERTVWLQAPQGFDGLLGTFRLLPDGTVERGFAVYEVTRDGYRLSEPAPARFGALPEG